MSDPGFVSSHPLASPGLISCEQMLFERRRLADEGLRLVFTNGCFDLIHRGHVELLAFARRQGDALAVGLNSDASVRRLKGPGRPINPQNDRAAVLAALRAVDFVVLFDEDDPSTLIEQLRPDVLVKGRDWAGRVAGSKTVESYGGRVVLADLVPGRSSTALIEALYTTQGVDRT